MFVMFIKNPDIEKGDKLCEDHKEEFDDSIIVIDYNGSDKCKLCGDIADYKVRTVSSK